MICRQVVYVIVRLLLLWVYGLLYMTHLVALSSLVRTSLLVVNKNSQFTLLAIYMNFERGISDLPAIS